MEQDIISYFPAIILIEYCPSKIPREQNPLRPHQRVTPYKISVPPDILRILHNHKDLYYPIYWPEEHFENSKDFQDLDLEQFGKKCKLQLLQNLNEKKMTIVVYTTRHVIQKIALALNDELPRKISFSQFLVHHDVRSVNYVYFRNNEISFYHDELFKLLSKDSEKLTALMN